jgi:uncharacterized protein
MFWLNLGMARDHSGAPVTFTFREELPALDGPDGTVSFLGPVDVEVTVTCVEGQYWLNGTVRGRVELTCARCLKRFEYPFEVALAERYVQGRDRGDAEASCVKGDLVDFTDKVTEGILLALPMRALCHPGCRGLCPECGQMLNEATCDCRTDNIDPRFAALAKLLKPNPKGVE